MKVSTYLIIAGIISIIGGFFALANPVLAGFAVAILVGWVFIASGALMLVSFFAFGGAQRSLWPILWGLLTLAAGIALLRSPVMGLMTLTMIMGVVFVISGIIRVMLAMPLKTNSLFWALVLSGGLSIALGVIILGNGWGWAPFALGTLVAVELLSSGVSKLTYGMMHRSV